MLRRLDVGTDTSMERSDAIASRTARTPRSNIARSGSRAVDGRHSAHAGSIAGRARNGDVGDRDRRAAPPPSRCEDRTGPMTGRSHATTRTSAPGPASEVHLRAPSTPPRGPSPGDPSGITAAPRADSSSGSPPIGVTSDLQPTPRSALATRLGHGHPVDVDQGLGTPHPPACAAGQHGTDERRPGSVSGDPRRVELQQERATPLGLVEFTDLGGHVGQTPQAPQEPSIGRFDPAHVATPAPAVGSQGVEPAVIADPIRRVPLHRVATQVTERRPTVEVSRR